MTPLLRLPNSINCFGLRFTVQPLCQRKLRVLEFVGRRGVLQVNRYE
jgi:hypothetical protein